MIGSELDHFKITALLGEGGMGTVYRAVDTKLDRDVAIKVLPEEFVSSPDRLARFEREAKAVAALSHPNILAIHDLGACDGTTYAVMELLEGATLGERLEEGALPTRKAVEAARQAAQGLAAAHEQGIVHRDLKPDNLFLTRDGRLKILDFGLARIDEVSADGVTEAPTRTQHTDPGTVLGTVGYMSPEQVRGEAADHRTDIFSLGVVLYEALSGRRAFQAASRVETMTAILREEPAPFDASTARSIPPSLQRILYRCLEKAPEERFQSARDLAFALDSLGESSTEVSSVGGPVSERAAPVRRASWVLPSAMLVLGLLLGAITRPLLVPGRPNEPPRVRSLTFSGLDNSVSASPDGRMLAFASSRDGRSRIWLKQVAGGGEEPLTEGEDYLPRFSPDGESLLFVRREGQRSMLYRTGLIGGQTRKIADDARFADWSPDGRQIVLARRERNENVSAVISIVDVASGETREVARLRDVGAYGVRWSPDGSRIAVVESSVTGNAPAKIALIDITDGEIERIDPPGNPSHLSPIAWLGEGDAFVYALSTSRVGDQSGGLSQVLRYELDSERHETVLWTQDLFPVLGSGFDNTIFDVLGPETLVYHEVSVRQNLEQFQLVSRGPSSIRRPLTQGNADDRQPVYSPDGGQILFTSNRSGNLDLWTMDLATGATSQITDDEANDWDPAFTPDGESIVWSSDRGGNLEIWTARIDGSQARQLSDDGHDAENPTVTPDSWVVFWSSNPEKAGIWKVRLDGSEATRIVEGAFIAPDVSPDGRYAVFLQLDAFRSLIRVVEIDTGAIVPFEIVVPHNAASTVLWGRSRWLPDGSAIAFAATNDQGLSGIFAQDFVPGENTAETRRPLAGFSQEYVSESFGISADGRYLTLSGVRQVSSLMLAEGVPGIVPPVRNR